MIIKGGTIFQENKRFAKKDIRIENDRIIEISEPVRKKEPDSDIIDATGLYVLPGLVDIHSHGAVGYDFCDGDMAGMKEMLSYQRVHGVTSYCPTSMTLKKEKLLEIFAQMKGLKEAIHADSKKYSNLIGFNMEGPFLDPAKKGAHREEDILKPDVDFFQKCNDACGNQICLVTVAPNVDGGIEFIKEVAKSEHITVSVGHTGADYDTAKEALKNGANHITHLFNAMDPLHHRNPGLITAASEDDNCYAELICDGVHVHESMVRAAFKLFPGRIVLISDSMRATGLKDGEYELGGQWVKVTGNKAILADGTIAGSVTNLFECMRKAISFGILPEEAIAAATANPAKSVGIYKEVGSLTVGKKADIIIADQEFNIVSVI